MKPKIKKGGIIVLLTIMLVWLLFSLFPIGGETKVYNSDPKTTTQTYIPKFVDEGDLMFYNESDSLLVQIDLEIADNEQDIGYGLMYRKEMDELRGMIFIMSMEEIQSFWMKNTFIPLDIIFIDSDKRIVDISKENKALDESEIKSKKAALLVLELNAGFTDKYGIKEGHRIEYSKN